MAETDLIAGYLLDLRKHLRGYWPQRQRILAEVNDHLCEAAERGQLEGLEEREAQRQALARFGEAREVARRFAEERLRGAAERALPWLAATTLAMLALQHVEALFPVRAAFHWSEPQPLLQRLLLTGQLLQWAALPLLGLALALRRRTAIGFALALEGVMLAALVGGEGTGIGLLMLGHYTIGAASRVPLMIRLAVGLGGFFAFIPTLAAQDAYDSVKRALRAA